MTYGSQYGQRALQGEVERVRRSRPGTRNDTLYLAAFKLGTLVPQHVTETVVVDRLTDAAVITTGDAAVGDPLTDVEIARTIRSGIEAGMQQPRAVAIGYTRREDALRDIEIFAEAWEQTPMGGWIGRRCKKVMPGIIAIAYRVGGLRKVPLGIARLTVEAGVASRGTVCKALSDLEELGWATPTASATVGRARTFDLHIPAHRAPSRTQDDPTPPTATWQRPNVAMTGHDAGRRGSLGPTSERVLLHLAKTPGQWHTQVSVARELGVHPGTVGRAVADRAPLVRYGLVERDSRARVTAPLEPTVLALDSTALLDGTLGARDRQRAYLARAYQASGFLTDDLRWIDPSDGTPTRKATWLELERAYERLMAVLHEPLVKEPEHRVETQPVGGPSLELTSSFDEVEPQ